MAPRWFKNINFGKDVTNLPPERVLENLKTALQGKIDEISFGSTLDQISIPQSGPIIEEIFSEPEEIFPEDEEIPPVPEGTTPEPEETTPEDEEIIPAPEESPPQPELSLPQPEVSLPQPEVSLPQPEVSLPQPAGRSIRRSGRKRYAPLDFARGERLIYRRAGDAFEIVGKEPGFPAKRQYGRKKTKPIRPPSNAVPVAPIELKDAKKGNYKYGSKQINSQIAGCIRLEPGASKPEAKINHKQSFVFLVRTGQVIIKVKEENPDEVSTHLADQKSGWVVLTQGQRYSIRNCGMRTADVIYFLMDTKN